MSNFWKWRIDLIKKYPMASVFGSFLKGVLFTVLVYEFLL